MRKVARLKFALLRVIGISLLIMIVIFGISKSNPKLIVKLRQLLFPSAAVSPQIWILESQKFHTLCGHVESKRTEYHKERSFKAIIEHYSEEVEKVNYQAYRYVVSNHDLCESCLKNQFLGLDGGRIAVFRGTPSKPGPITEKLDINLKKLPKEEVEDLRKGIPFKDGREKLQLLEGLNGLSTE